MTDVIIQHLITDQKGADPVNVLCMLTALSLQACMHWTLPIPALSDDGCTLLHFSFYFVAKTGICSERSLCTGEKRVTQWLPQVVDGSGGLCQESELICLMLKRSESGV